VARLDLRPALRVWRVPSAPNPHPYTSAARIVNGKPSVDHAQHAPRRGEIGHVANECVVFDACGPNCEVRTIVFGDSSRLVIHESIVGFIPRGNSPGFLQITLTIDGASSTGRFAGATGDGTEVVNLAANAVIIASGTITLP
jgi:hypothetical protein